MNSGMHLCFEKVTNFLKCLVGVVRGQVCLCVIAVGVAWRIWIARNLQLLLALEMVYEVVHKEADLRRDLKRTSVLIQNERRDGIINRNVYTKDKS